MLHKVGEVTALFRYPVKSMGGETLSQAELGWHGLTGDRRLAFRKLSDQGGFPWLTASRIPELLAYVPVPQPGAAAESLPSHIRTPDGKELALFGPELAAEVEARFGSPIAMTHLDHGIFDEASVSAITTATVQELAKLAGHRPDVRRFRPNIQLDTDCKLPFAEDAWVGGVLSFGATSDAAAIAVTHWDVRCAMINLDPDTAQSTPQMLKAVVKERNNQAGIYASVLRRGMIEVGQSIYFHPI